MMAALTSGTGLFKGGFATQLPIFMEWKLDVASLHFPYEKAHTLGPISASLHKPPSVVLVPRSLSSVSSPIQRMACHESV